MKNKSQNKYQIVEDRMEAYCAECKSRESDQCLIGEKSCGKFESKYRELYFELLYPKHPCRFCIVRPTCNEKIRCEEFDSDSFIFLAELAIAIQFWKKGKRTAPGGFSGARFPSHQ